MAASKPVIYIDNDPGIPEVFVITPGLIDALKRKYARVAAAYDIRLGGGPEDLPRNVAEAEVLVGWTFPARKIVGMAPKLRWIQLIGAGLDHLLPLDWLPESIALTTASGAHRPKIDEFMMMALLMVNNRIPEVARNQRNGKFDHLYSTVITGKTVLVIGLGATGSAAAESARKLGLRVIAVRHGGPGRHPHADEVHGPEALPQLLPQADFVVVAVPKTKETLGLLGPAALKAMKPGAGLVSIGRHGIVDEATLMDLLESGHLSGAVYDIEDPHHVPSSPALWSARNLMIMPHSLSNDTGQFIVNAMDVVFENLGRYLAGTPLAHRVDPRKEY